MELDQRPPGPEDWGYRPADASTPQTNPPAFTWRPTKEADFYQFQISVSASFENIAYEIQRWRWNAHCPPVTLPVGTYYWRYRAVNEKRRGRSSKPPPTQAALEYSPWSRVRTFSVSPKALPLPQPSSTQLRNLIALKHPRLFIEPVELGEMRHLARQGSSGAWAGLAAAAEALIRKPPDADEPPKYPSSVKEKSEEWKKIWWGNRERCIAVTNGAATLAFASLAFKDDRYRNTARSLLMDFAGWNPKGSTSYAYNDEAAMPALYYGSRAADWLWEELDARQRSKLVKVMEERGEQCYEHLLKADQLWRPYDSHINRAWHFLGETAIAFYHEIPEAPEWLDYAMTVLYTAYPAWGGDDGGWHEGADYWASYMERFMYWADAVHAGFGLDVFERPFFRETGYFGMYLLPPGTRTGGFGDLSPRIGSHEIAPVMYALATAALNPHWMWHARASGKVTEEGYMDCLRSLRAARVTPEPPESLPTSRLFGDVGLAVMNTNLIDGTKNTQIQFKSSPYGSQSHGYNAQNAFIITTKGREVFPSTGRRDVYGSPHHEGWMWSTRSDNALLVNGKGQKKHTAGISGRISAFLTSPRLDMATGETRDAYGPELDRWRRRIIFLKPSVIVIHDLLEAPKPSEFTWLLHAPDRFELGDNSARWKGDFASAGARFLQPSALDLHQTDQFDPPPAKWTGWKLKDWHLTAKTRLREQRQEFITLLSIDAPEPKSTLKREGPGWMLDLELPDGAVRISLGPDRYKVESSGASRELRD